jgi:hypothetical protein
MRSLHYVEVGSPSTNPNRDHVVSWSSDEVMPGKHGAALRHPFDAYASMRRNRANAAARVPDRRRSPTIFGAAHIF